MPTEQELREKYCRMKTDELMDMVANKTDYTEMAVSVTLSELERRDVPLESVRNLQPAIAPGVAPWRKNCLFDLNFFQKLASYFLGMFTIIRPVRFFIRTLYSPGFWAEGYLLKASQFNYYAIAGFVFLVVAFASNRFSGLLIGGIWAGGFVPVYLFDMGYNKQRQLDKLQKILEQGELPFGY
jgi:hypothetical protein